MTTRTVTRRALRRRRTRARVIALVVTGLLASGSAVAVSTSAQADTSGCFATDITLERWQDDRGVVVFTANEDQESDAAASGYEPTGDAFAASSQPSRGLVPLYDAYRPSSRNHAWILWSGEYEGVVSNGWDGRGAIAYVSPKVLPGCDTQAQLTRAVRGGTHTVAYGGVEADARADEGYRLEYSWYAPAAASNHPDPANTPAPAPSTTAQPTPTPAPIPTTKPTPPPTTPPQPTPSATPRPTQPPAPVPAPEPEQPPNGRDGDGVFTIATYPDTQQEVFNWAGSRFVDRSTWLVSQRDTLDVRFVVHVGDVVNWDTDAHEQFVKAAAAMDPLEAARIPYQLSIGNHDTLATGPGGGARDSKRTREYQRDTTTFNSFWTPADYTALAGTFEPGRVDNTYSAFTAEGADWLVLNLELWPRVAVVDWAEDVISSHPESNVIIQTHSFLNGSADIDGAGQSLTRWKYGDSSPQYVYDRLVAPYDNVKVVMSGHVGGATSKVVTTAKGNKVAYLLQTLHSNKNNPTRLSQFDVSDGIISTKVFAPEDGSTQDIKTLTGLSFLQN